MPAPLVPDGDCFAPALAYLQSRAADHFGAASIRIVPVARFSSGFTRVLKARVHGDAQSDAVYIKVYVPTNGTPQERARQLGYLSAETDRLRAACRAFAATPQLKVPRLIASLPDALSIVTAEARGTRLDAVLRRLCLWPTPRRLRDAENTFALVGEWLRRFQQHVPPRDPEAVDKDYRRYLDDRLGPLVAETAGAFTAADRDAVLKRFDTLHAQLSAHDRTPVAAHADFCPINVLVDADGIAVIDLAMSTDRVRTLDLAHMYFHLELLARRVPVERWLVRRLQRALLSGYAAGYDVEAPLFQLMLQQHAICHLAPWAGTDLRLVDRWRFTRRVHWALRLVSETTGSAATVS